MADINVNGLLIVEWGEALDLSPNKCHVWKHTENQEPAIELRRNGQNNRNAKHGVLEAMRRK